MRREDRKLMEEGEEAKNERESERVNERKRRKGINLYSII